MSGEAMLQVRDLRCGYEHAEIVHGVSFDVARGEFACILGANGCGKSTTLKTILGLIVPFSGTIEKDGRSTVRMREPERAKLFAYIPQSHTPPFPYAVRDVVMLGRTPYIDRLSRATKDDERIVDEAMERMDIQQLALRPYTQLSGGQQQLVLIARALAQQPDLLVMDEPTASLDFGNQQLVLRQMRELSHTGMSVLMVTHDPDHATLVADRVIVMEQGRVSAQGTPAEVMSTECMQRIYQADVEMVEVDIRGKKRRICVPIMD